ncbi:MULTISPECIES: ATP-dependent zinc protease [Pseudoalteromonas]|uniref:ATP-dependent zinc protease family protein n=1 Tax=Pseudoalteromonas TaxID=53246 RepID=UPI0015832CCF|nr:MULTISPECIES: ATP-dependent zinc protease [Pseudoalteromonas]MDI4653818.1 ATP-dependent zinc protease [Pseudoalteromonas shioyasakiensis]NUJ40028.1 ATP-dependent zinc protease [Pseudoalteromonas sp. 0303]
MSAKIIVGWREWLGLPELGIEKIKAKVDTGARTSCIHAFDIEEFSVNGEAWVKFTTHPLQDDVETTVECRAKVVERKYVTSSSGQRELRYFIETKLVAGTQSWPVRVTLSNRSTMKFRMLLGRTAMENRIVVDPALSHLL